MKVIIVAYNQFELLQMEIEALRLLAGIEERDLIIVDNGSTDGSAEYIKSLQKKQAKHPVFLIENSENMGFCKAVNQGIEAAKTPYVALLNNDTKIIQGFVMHLEQALESGKDVFSVSAIIFSYSIFIPLNAGNYETSERSICSNPTLPTIFIALLQTTQKSRTCFEDME